MKCILNGISKFKIGGLEMLLVEEVDNKDFLIGLFDVMYDELPTPKSKKKK